MRTTTEFKEICRRLAEHHGIDKSLASERLHDIKKYWGRAPDHDVLFDMTGSVFDPSTLERLGSLTAGGKRG